MCRNIRTLHNFEPPATEDEVHAAAVQYVRKISGFTKPSHANEAAFEHAVQEIAASSRRLLAELVTNAPPRDREVERERAQARAAARFAPSAPSSTARPRRRPASVAASCGLPWPPAKAAPAVLPRPPSHSPDTRTTPDGQVTPFGRISALRASACGTASPAARSTGRPSRSA